MANDDQFLVSAAADSTVIVWRVIDKGEEEGEEEEEKEGEEEEGE